MTDVQLLLLVLVLWNFQVDLQGLEWILPVILLCLVMDMLVLLAFRAVRSRWTGVLTYPIGCFSFSLVNSLSIFSAMLNVWERKW